MTVISAEKIIIVSLCYFALIFFVAYYADRRRRMGRSLLSNPHIYTLSIAIYCTSWTFYGSVGKAATSGLDYLPIYLGPTLIAFGWWFLLRKMVRVSKEQNITSLADFLASRYDRSAVLGAIVTLFAVFGITPYIALQLKAIAQTLDILFLPLKSLPEPTSGLIPYLPGQIDSAFIITLLLGLFGILFGARHLDSSERHEGLVVAVALESLVKLVAFVAVGIFVTYGLFDGFIDLFQQFHQRFPDRSYLFAVGTAEVPYTKWFTLIIISMAAIMFLPRQFHIMVTENANEEHIKKAMWRFPAYLFLINLFVLPIAMGGLLLNHGDTTQADYFVLTLPLGANQPWLALLVFIGGLSAAAGMVMVSSVTLATMILNHLVMPVILKLKLRAQDLSGILINIKRLGIVGVVLLGYLYFIVIGDSYALVNIGLISFMAAAQFAPAMIGAIYWKRANKYAATWSISLGFAVWVYTLLIPSFARSGWISSDLLQYGPLGISLLKPLELFGLSGFDMYTHSLFWSLMFNLGVYCMVSILTRQSDAEKKRAIMFVDVFVDQDQPDERLTRISKAPTIVEFVDLMSKFIGEKPAQTAISAFLADKEIDHRGSLNDQDIFSLKTFTERTLAGHVGAGSARIILENYLAARGSEMENIFDIFGSVTIDGAISREHLSVLYDVSQLVSSGDSFQSKLDRILELLAEQFKFDLCVIRFLEPKTRTLLVKSLVGETFNHFGKSERNLSNETYIGQAFLSNVTMVVNDTDELEKPASSAIIQAEGITCFAHLPIVLEGEPVGILSAFSRSGKGLFTIEFIALLENIAGQIGIARRNEQQIGRLVLVREQEREMQIAKEIQMALLPASLPSLEDIQVAGLCVPAHQVGGDYYDFIIRKDGRYDVVIADVSGHNIGSALIMAETRTFIHSRVDGINNPAAMLQALNDYFLKDLDRSDLFVTMFYLQYNLDDHQLIYSNAGHNPPLLWRQKVQQIEPLDAEGLIFGIHKKINFEQKNTRLEPGDILLLYTDGIVEAEDSHQNLFGQERLEKLLSEEQQSTPQELIDQILTQVRLFTGYRHFNDDVTLLAMKILK
ncbi:SpoIIE family protein phosphatase [Pelovirga terrestris]|nr:SpoIIE family protein phosphatase [Pelovirga terrestris]